MIAFVIARTSLRRLTRDRAAMFFVALLPILVIVLVASFVGLDELRIGVVDEGGGRTGAALVSRLRGLGAVEVDPRESLETARRALRRGELDAVLVLPAGMDDAVRRGETVSLPVYADRANTNQQAGALAVRGAVTGHGATVFAAHFASTAASGDFDTNLRRATEQLRSVGHTGVTVRVVDASSDTLPSGFSYAAPTQLVLFVFVTAIGTSALVIQSRLERIYARALAAPITVTHIVGGEALAYLGVTLLQSALILGVGTLFGVHWGDPLAAGALVFVFALVGTGAGMFCGGLFRTTEQATSVGPVVGIGMGMLGGCMWPLEIVPPVMRTLGHLTPHGWAVDGWTELLARDGHLGDIGTELGVLAAFAAVLLGAAVVTLRRAVIR